MAITLVEATMRTSSRALVVITSALACVLGALTACGDDEGAGVPPPSLAPDGGADAVATPPDGAPDSGPSCPVARPGQARGFVTMLDGSDPPPPVPGARICVHDRPDLPCVSSAEDGSYEHSCLPEGDVGILFSKDEVGRTLWLRVITPGIPQQVEGKIVTQAENVRFFGDVGVAYPRSGHGIVTLLDSDRSAKGGMYVEPLEQGVEGPFYSSDGVNLDRDAGPTAGFGLAVMLAPAGSLDVALTHVDGGGCQQVLGGWGSDAGKITVPVLEDTETLVLVRCP
jgi:hypothetical protein